MWGAARSRRTVRFLVAIVALQAALLLSANVGSTPPSTGPDRERLEFKVGQLLMIGLPGPTLDEATRALIRGRHIGNAVYLQRNAATPVQVAVLSAGLQEEARAANAGLPMLIAIDQEGAPTVLRLGDFNGFTTLNYNPAIACLAKQDLKTAQRLLRREAAAIAAEMLAVGINVDLAPVADVWSNPRNVVVGQNHRTFGGDPARVSRLVSAFIEGLHAGGVLSTAKHFPGHGNTSEDSHLTLLVDPAPPGVIRRRHLPPFRAAIAAGADLVMPAHVGYPALDSSRGPRGLYVPATFSRPIVSALLRDELGFDGVVISDEFSMGALRESGESAIRAAIKAISAGVDVIISLDQGRAAAIYDALLNRALADPGFRERVNDAFARITALKARVPVAGDLSVVRSPAHLRLQRRLALLSCG